MNSAALNVPSYPPLQFVIPGLIPAGLSILAGRPKEGKSWLALAPVVLVAFDADKVGADGSPGAGDCAAAWWLNVLPNAVRLRPLLHDVNSLPDAEDVRSWVGRRLERAGHPAN
jgi:hypothetical protein